MPCERSLIVLTFLIMLNTETVNMSPKGLRTDPISTKIEKIDDYEEKKDNSEEESNVNVIQVLNELPVPNRPIIEPTTERKVILKWLTNMNRNGSRATIDGFVIENSLDNTCDENTSTRDPNECALYEPYGMVSLPSSSEEAFEKFDEFWSTSFVDPNDQNHTFRVRTFKGLSLSNPSLPSHKISKKFNDLSVKEYTPHAPIVSKLIKSKHGNRYLVEWKIPDMWVLSNSYVFVLETMNNSNKWIQKKKEFSDGDKDGWIRMIATTNQDKIRIKILDMDYEESHPFTVNLKFKGRDNLAQERRDTDQESMKTRFKKRNKASRRTKMKMKSKDL